MSDQIHEAVCPQAQRLDAFSAQAAGITRSRAEGLIRDGMVTVTGVILKKILTHLFRDEAFEEGAHTEFYQLSKGMRVVCSKSRHELITCQLDGEDIEDDKVYTVGIQEFH